MGKVSAKSRTVEVELPEEAFQHRTWQPQEVAREMRLLWMLEEVRSRRLGFGKAEELSGVPVAQFLLLMGKHQISPFDYDDDELAREVLNEAPEELPMSSRASGYGSLSARSL